MLVVFYVRRVSTLYFLNFFGIHSYVYIYPYFGIYTQFDILAPVLLLYMMVIEDTSTSYTVCTSAAHYNKLITQISLELIFAIQIS